MVMDRAKVESIWAFNMKITEGYWNMWRTWAESMSLWQEKGKELLNTYMQGSQQVFDEQKKWLEAAIMQASKSQEQMQMIMKEAFLTAMESMNEPSYNPWLMMWNWQGTGKKAEK